MALGLGGIRPLTGAQDRVAELAGPRGGFRPLGIWIYVPPSDDGMAEELWVTGSGYPVKPGEVLWIGGQPDPRRAVAEFCASPGTVLSMRCNAANDDGAIGPGVGETFTYTLWKNGVPTGCEVVLTGAGEANSRGKSIVQVSTNDMDRLVVRVEPSAGAPEANHNATLRFLPDPDED